jgi:adenylyl cyclase-associated protein
MKAFVAERKFLLISTKSKKPAMSDPAYMELLKPLQEEIAAVNEIRDKNRGKAQFNHLSAVAEGIPVIAWITIDTKAYKHVDESLGSAQYWGNRVLKEFKDKYVILVGCHIIF